MGDIPSDEIAGEEPEAVMRSDGSWLIDGTLTIEKFKQIFELDDFPDQTEGGFHTIGGFVMSNLGHIPKESDNFSWNGLYFEVMDMDRNRVDKILVSKPVIDEAA